MKQTLATLIKRRILDITYLPLILCALITIFVIAIMFNQTQDILTDRLKEKLIGISSTAALQFNQEELFDIQDENDLENPKLSEIIEKLKKIRDANKDIRYIYIWRRTETPNIVEFVVDAEMLDPIDENNNDLIDEDEIPPIPGEDYDISDTPEVNGAFTIPVTTTEFISDKWGTFASAWAPIKDKNDQDTNLIIGIDVEIKDFYKLISATFVPFILLAILLLLILCIQTLYLVRIWRGRVQFVQELDRQKDELLSIVSHQLAAPVSSIKWYLEMLQDGDLGKLNTKQKEHIESTQEIVTNMSDLVGMILEVSRIQLGRMHIDKEKLELVEFFEEIEKVIKPKAILKKIDYKIHISDKIKYGYLDKRLTRMVFENLLTNAIKYTPEHGHVKLDVEIKDGKLHAIVKDNGIGIPKSEQNRIFEKLYRASNARNNAEGNGFGLYITKGAIEGQGGNIRFESKENGGTTFFVSLPLK